MKLVARILEHPHQALTSLLLGNNAVNIMLVLVTSHMLHYLPLSIGGHVYGPIARFLFEVVFIASFLLVFGEIIPKSIALKHPGGVSKATVFPLFLFHEFIGLIRVRQVLALISEKLVNAVRKIFGEKEEFANHGDIQLAVEMSMKEGHLSKEEGSIVDRILMLKDLPSASIIRDRSMVKIVYPQDLVKDAIYLGTRNRISKLPVYDRKKDEVVGIFDVSKAILGREKGIVKEFMLPPYFIPKVKAREIVLEMVLEGKEDLAIVIDEFGTYVGIISTGQIYDFLTKSVTASLRKPVQKGLRTTENGIYVDAEVNLEVIEETLNFVFPKGDYHTLGGYIMATTGTIPREKEWLVVGGLKFYIDEARPNKMVRVFIQRKGK
jgi:CBS domain containing-hemolysin-like protein